MPATRFLHLLLSCSLIGLLAGCVSNPPAPVRPYAAEAGPYSARLLVRGGLQPRDGYGIYAAAGAQQCTHLQRIAIGTTESKPPATLIRAERLITLTSVIVVSADKKTCSNVMSFVPRTGRSYVLNLVRSEKGGCYAYVMDATDPDKEILEPSLRRRDTTGDACRPLGQSLGPAASRTSSTDDDTPPAGTESVPQPAAPGSPVPGERP